MYIALMICFLFSISAWAMEDNENIEPTLESISKSIKSSIAHKEFDNPKSLGRLFGYHVILESKDAKKDKEILDELQKKCSLSDLVHFLKTSDHLYKTLKDNTSSLILKALVTNLKRQSKKGNFLTHQILNIEKISDPQLPLEKEYNSITEECRKKIIQGILAGHEFHPIFTLKAQLLKGHTDQIMSIAWSPDGNYLVSGGYDKQINVWNAEKNYTCNTISKERDIVSLDWHPGGRYIAFGKLGKIVEIWDNEKKNVEKWLSIDDILVNCIKWSKQGNYLAVGGINGKIFIYNVPNFESYNFIETKKGPVTSISWHPQEKELACILENSLYSINIQTGKLKQKFSDRSWQACDFNTEGNLALVGKGIGRDKNFLHVKANDSTDLTLKNVHWHPNDHYFVAGSDKGNLIFLMGNHIRYTKEKPNAPVRGVAWNPDGTKIASIVGDNTIKIWETSFSTFASKITTIPMALLTRYLLERYLENGGKPVAFPKNYENILQEQEYSNNAEWLSDIWPVIHKLTKDYWIAD